MKSFKFLCILPFFTVYTVKSFSQTITKYEKAWKVVDSLVEKRNLPASALAEVKKIYALAKKEQKDVEIIKALVYTIRLQEETRENNLVLSVKEIEKEINAAREPAVSILTSLEAELYWSYFQMHRTLIYGRTNTAHFKKEDIATWTSEDFHKKISELYLKSISKAELLKSQSLSKFGVLVVKGNVSYLRPSLYDLLAQRALDYFKNNENEITKPAYAFEISQPQAFAPAAFFISYRFNARDTSSRQYKALHIYQDLIAFHLKDKNKDAIVDVDADRIEFVYSNAVMENKDSLYEQALKDAIRQFGKAARQAGYLLASFYNRLAGDPEKDTAYVFARIKARDILEKIVADSSNRDQGWTNSYNLLKEINKPDFSFEVEIVNIPGQPFRALVKYKNLTSLFFRILKADSNTEELLNNNDEKTWSRLGSASYIKSWNQPMPPVGDMREHSVEIKIDALPVGRYIILASDNKNFSATQSLMGGGLVHISAISYVLGENKLFALDRETGMPLNSAKISVYQQDFNARTSDLKKIRTGEYSTDKNGLVTIPKKYTDVSGNYIFDLHFLNDSLLLNQPLYLFYSNSLKMKEQIKVFFFTDRSIYRPGQLVLFKGLAIKETTSSHTIATGYTTTIYLRNVNYQLVDSLKVTTSDFGSFSGQFHLPQTGLNGSYNITDKNTGTSTEISVEEYKRPKFYVLFDTVKNSYRAEDSIALTGTAKAYAGNNVDGATVHYRVVRHPRLQYYRQWLPSSSAVEITQGTTTTDRTGKFLITFKALADKKIDKNLHPLFEYQVYADVTDLNGETRSAESNVRASYQSLLLKVELPETLPADSFKNISIITENMSGAFQTAPVQLTIRKLIPENRLVRARYWMAPDQFLMTRDEYIQYFPHDEYKNETDQHTWRKGDIIFSQTYYTNTSGQWNINSLLKPGYYSLTFSIKDKDGQEIKEEHFLELLDAKANAFNRPLYFWTSHNNQPIEPGQTTTLSLGTSTDIFLVQDLHKQKDTGDHFSFPRLNNEKKNFTYGATEMDRRGYGIHFFFVKDNRLYQFSEVIAVPWSNKELNIEYITFRDKTLPGSQETWKMKISGKQTEKVTAESLVSMYDASLDQFRENTWTKPDIWPTFGQTGIWDGDQNFGSSASSQRNVYEPVVSFNKTYDRLLTNNFEPTNVIMVAFGKRALTNERQASFRESETASGLSKNKGYLSVQDSVAPETKKEPNISTPQSEIQVRKNFKETAFFFPDLRTDVNGVTEFSFTVPEALTTWKLQAFSHTRDLAMGIASKKLLTQKPLMVQTSMPRFLRQGDHMELTATIVNLSDTELTGQMQLELKDALGQQSVDGWFMNTFPNQYFTVAAKQSAVLQFPIQVPNQFNHALLWRVIAKNGNLADGEEDILPVLSDRQLVTETFPLNAKGITDKQYVFHALANSGNRETLQNHSVTIEYTSNPAWYVVQALPYLMQYPYECAEQTWNRYYANSLSGFIVHSSPHLRNIFEQWNKDSSTLISNLQKNPQLKTALLEETPWVLEANNETDQKKNISNLFDTVLRSTELTASLDKLKAMQNANGSFPWFKGGPDDYYITQYIVTGIGRLKKVTSGNTPASLGEIAKKAISWLDNKIIDAFRIEKQNKGGDNYNSYYAIQYLYMRSYFKEIAIPPSTRAAYEYYLQQSAVNWMRQGKYLQGMIALALCRNGNKQFALSILRSLKETAIYSEDLGTYWKDAQPGWNWWQAPIETQSLLVEAFIEISKDTSMADGIKTWLLKNKQTNNWHTTKATADACYAFLLKGTDWLNMEPVVEIKLGSLSVDSKESNREAGTGYLKKIIPGNLVKPEMGRISLRIQPGKGTTFNAPTWGAVYWQYFENLDKITTASTTLGVDRKLFIETITDRGPQLVPVGDNNTEIHIGDKIMVRIVLKTDRDLEYVHMKDTRAASMEPLSVISGYQWQGGLGYYQSMSDAAANFFFNYLPKGTYVFEYTLFATHAGSFSAGITTIQCMYAPEFGAHSQGGSINVTY